MESIISMQLRMELIQEYSFFAPAEVNEQIKSLRKGERFEITKLAEQKGMKIVTS